MYVREGMSTPPPTIDASARASEAATKMRLGRVDALVATEEGVPVGLLTRADLNIRLTAAGDDDSLLVCDLCDQLVLTATPRQQMAEVQRGMRRLELDLVVVVDYDEPVGLVRSEGLWADLDGPVP